MPRTSRIGRSTQPRTLKEELDGELNFAGSAECLKDPSIAGSAHERIVASAGPTEAAVAAISGSRESHTVEYVEHLGPELNAIALGPVPVLHEPDVPVMLPVRPKDVAACVSFFEKETSRAIRIGRLHVGGENRTVEPTLGRRVVNCAVAISIRDDRNRPSVVVAARLPAHVVGIAGLKLSNDGQLPTTEKGIDESTSSAQISPAVTERHIPHRADYKTMRNVEVSHSVLVESVSVVSAGIPVFTRDIHGLRPGVVGRKGHPVRVAFFQARLPPMIVRIGTGVMKVDVAGNEAGPVRRQADTAAADQIDSGLADIACFQHKVARQTVLNVQS